MILNCSFWLRRLICKFLIPNKKQVKELNSLLLFFIYNLIEKSTSTFLQNSSNKIRILQKYHLKSFSQVKSIQIHNKIRAHLITFFKHYPQMRRLPISSKAIRQFKESLQNYLHMSQS